MDLGLTDRIAIVTGAARGLGAAVARALAGEGCRVACADRDSDGAAAVADAIASGGGQAMAHQVDVTDKASVQALVAAVLQRWGQVDILINNAGILRLTGPMDIGEEEWDQVLDTNLKGVFLCCQAVLEPMQRQGCGAIVNISSKAGRAVSRIGGVHYSAAKIGVLNVTRHLARDMAPHGIRINAVCPGGIDTPMIRAVLSDQEMAAGATTFPMRRWSSPDEQAKPIVFLASDAASYITGATLDVNGGAVML